MCFCVPGVGGAGDGHLTNRKFQLQEDRKQVFEALVLQGIWLLILLGMGKRIPYDCRVWRGSAIDHMDVYGNQSEGAKAHRREVSFPDFA